MFHPALKNQDDQARRKDGWKIIFKGLECWKTYTDTHKQTCCNSIIMTLFYTILFLYHQSKSQNICGLEYSGTNFQTLKCIIAISDIHYKMTTIHGDKAKPRILGWFMCMYT